MTTKSFLILILYFIFLSGYSQSSEKDIICNNLLLAPIMSGDNTNYNPTVQEIDYAKKISLNFIDSAFKVSKDTISLKSLQKDYYRQYICYLDSEKNKIIWINWICSEKAKKNDLKIVWYNIVTDDKLCVIDIKINLTKNYCFDFSYSPK